MQEKAPYSAWRAPWEEWAWDNVGGVSYFRVHRSMGSLWEASRRATARAARRDRRLASRRAGPPRGGARRGGRAGRARLRREEPEQRAAAAPVQQHGDRLGAGAQEREQQEGLAPARVAQAAHQRALRARGAGREHTPSLAT